jgi:hypothetical protein
MAMGLVVRQQLWRIRWPLTMILEQWSVGKDMPLAINHSDGGWQEIFDRFSLPEGLKELYGHLHELDDAAEAAILAVAKAERSKILLNSIEIDMHATGGERQAELEKKLRPVMVACLERTNEAIRLIDKMYD